MARSSILLAAVLATALTRWAGAGVIVVDAAGGGDFTSLSAAAAASADGDTLLVRPGNYQTPFEVLTLGSHSLVIVGDTGGDVLAPPMIVSGLASDDFVVLRGLTIGASSFGGGVLTINACAGPVFVEDSVLHGRDGAAPDPPTAGASVFDSFSVSFQRCTLTGGDGFDSLTTQIGQSFEASAGSPAALVLGSRVAFHDCTLIGGTGGDDLGTPAGGGNGGSALFVKDGPVAFAASFVSLSGGLHVGGDGGGGCSDSQAPASCHGGDGVVLAGSSQLRHLDTELQPGNAGGGSGLPGQPVDAGLQAASTALAGVAVSLQASAPLRTGESGTLVVTGPPASIFLLLMALEPGFVPLPHFKGVLVTGLPLVRPQVLGVIPPSGVLQVPYATPDIGAFGLDALLLVDQLLVDQGADGVILSGPTTHVQVGPEF